MKRFVIGSVLFVGLSIFLVEDSRGQEKKDVKSTKEVMKACMGKGGLWGQLQADLKGKAKWDAATKKSKEFVELVSMMPENKPKKGDIDSWKKLSTDLVDNAKKLDEAIDKKDAKDAGSVAKSISSSCKACHTQHR